jgi:hypothetical protein
MCWRSSQSKDQGYRTFLHVNDINYWMSIGPIKFSDDLSPTSVNLQERYVSFNFEKESFLPGDEFITYQYCTFEDCFLPYKVGKVNTFMNIKKNGVPYFSPLWFGSKVGVSYLNPVNEEIVLCFHSMANYNDGTGVVVTNKDKT